MELITTFVQRLAQWIETKSRKIHRYRWHGHSCCSEHRLNVNGHNQSLPLETKTIKGCYGLESK